MSTKPFRDLTPGDRIRTEDDILVTVISIPTPGEVPGMMRVEIDTDTGPSWYEMHPDAPVRMAARPAWSWFTRSSVAR